MVGSTCVCCASSKHMKASSETYICTTPVTSFALAMVAQQPRVNKSEASVHSTARFGHSQPDKLSNKVSAANLCREIEITDWSVHSYDCSSLTYPKPLHASLPVDVSVPSTLINMALLPAEQDKYEIKEVIGKISHDFFLLRLTFIRSRSIWNNSKGPSEAGWPCKPTSPQKTIAENAY